jgi:phage major head subunit gpT-like protein
MRVPSTADTENYGWMKDLPGMREWVGQRVIHNLEASAAQLTNKQLRAHHRRQARDHIDDDKLGIYAPMLSMQGETRRAATPTSWSGGCCPPASPPSGFDGQYYFDTDHVGYTAAGAETSYSNTGGGSGAAVVPDGPVAHLHEAADLPGAQEARVRRR